MVVEDDEQVNMSTHTQILTIKWNVENTFDLSRAIKINTAPKCITNSLQLIMIGIISTLK